MPRGSGRTGVGKAVTLDLTKLPPHNLDEWMRIQTRFRSWRQLARAVGCDPGSVSDWRRGRKRPFYRHRRRLFEITKLECYGPANESISVKLAIVLDAANDWSRAIQLTPESRTRFISFLLDCFRNLTREGISNPEGITPQVIVKYKHTCSRERPFLLLAGKFFVANDTWKQTDLPLLRTAIEGSLGRTNKPAHPRSAARGIPLLNDLVRGNGLDWNEVQGLPVPQVEREGLRFSDELFIPFGDGMHEVRRDAFESWMAERSSSALLFSKSRESVTWKTARQESMSKYMLWRRLPTAPGAARTTSGAHHMQHFEEEFRRNPNPRWMRIHLQHHHGLGYARSIELSVKLQRQIGVHLPIPYLLASAAIGRVLDCSSKNLAGGYTIFTWNDLRGYELSVKLPRTFAALLKRDGRVRAGVVRALVRLGLQAWDEQRKCNGSGRTGLDRKLRKKLSKIHVNVRRIGSKYTWNGNVIRPRVFLVRRHVGKDRFPDGKRGYSRYVDFPLLESLQGGPTSASCAICCHPDRGLIDDLIRACTSRPELVARFQLDRKCKRATALHGLRKHAIRHVAEGPSAPVLRMPDHFLEGHARDNAPNLAKAILDILIDAEASSETSSFTRF